MTTVLSSRLHLSLVMERRGRQQETTRRARQRKTEQSRSRSRHRRDPRRTERPVHRVAGLQAEMRCTPTILYSQRKMPWYLVGKRPRDQVPVTGHPLDKKIHAAAIMNVSRTVPLDVSHQPRSDGVFCLMLRFVPSVSNMYVHVQNSSNCCTPLVYRFTVQIGIGNRDA
jgi:hypothetical protein